MNEQQVEIDAQLVIDELRQQLADEIGRAHV